ncbi:hypothetical protein A6X21_17300 [Planctopirus hydrillae]|uniref:Uncharacterized protein n=1 Tax=Planctopirus hydrillae TaxID=1841610 RepID=A0A1C3EMF9_9PLAN|nr:hypothetical protein A6X21_17300 [Planctopirus hydrillae]
MQAGVSLDRLKVDSESIIRDTGTMENWRAVFMVVSAMLSFWCSVQQVDLHQYRIQKYRVNRRTAGSC